MFVATVPALRGCHTQAKTLSELDDRVREVIALCIEAESEGLGEVPQSLIDDAKMLSCSDLYQAKTNKLF